MALKDLIATPAQSAANRLTKYAANRVKVLRRSYENDGKKPLSPMRFRLMEAQLFQREIEAVVSKLTNSQ